MEHVTLMTHVPETGAINWLRFFRRTFLVRVSCKSVTGFVWYQKPAPIRTLFYSKPESGMHVTKKHCTKVHNKHRPIWQIEFFIVCPVQCRPIAPNRIWNHFYAFYSARNFHSRRILYEKPVPENQRLRKRVDLWRRFLERVAWLLGKAGPTGAKTTLTRKVDKNHIH